MPRVTLQFRSAQMCRGAPFIVDDAPLHAVGFILAQKDGAVAGIGDPGWPERAFNTAGITPKAFGAPALFCYGNGAHRSDAPYLEAVSLPTTLLCYGYRSSYRCVF